MAETLPNNVDAEKSLIACLLMEPKQNISVCITWKLSESDFYSREMWEIYRCMLSLYTHWTEIDFVSLADELAKDWRGNLTQEYLMELSAIIMSYQNILTYIKIVKEKSALRQLIKMCQVSKTRAMAQWDSAEILWDLRKEFYTFLRKDVLDSWGCTLDDAFNDMIKAMDEGWLKPICNTWFKSLDSYVVGFMETAIWVIWARSSHGKSTLALNLLMNAVNQWIKVCLFSLEVDRQEIVQKIVSISWWINSQEYMWTPTETFKKKLEDTRDSLNGWLKNFVVFDKIKRYSQICSEIYAQAQQWVKLFCVDHIILIDNERKNSNNSARELWDVVNWFKWLAQELNICIILISQFNRWIDKRVLKDPQLSDFSGSSDIENIANVALWLFRPEYEEKWDVAPEDKGKLDVYVLKNRWWPIPPDKIRMWCNMWISMVWDLDVQDGT